MRPWPSPASPWTAAGLKRRHLLVVTDGENTDGADPALVASVLEKQPEEAKASLYFVAFDVDAEAFTRRQERRRAAAARRRAAPSWPPPSTSC